MALDASIYGQVQQPQQANPLATLAQAYQVKGLQSQMDRADRAEQQQNRLFSVLQSPEFQQGDTATKQRLAYGAGDVDAATKIGTAAATQSKDQREAEKAELSMAIDRYQASSGAFAEIAKNPAAAQSILGQMVQAKIIDPGYAQKVLTSASQSADPAQFWMQGANAAISAKDKLEMKIREQGQAITVRGQDLTAQTSRANNADTVGATIRGQDLVDKRSRESNTNSRVPSGYRLAADGQTLEFIPGGPADPQNKAGGGKPLTEGQSKSLLFASRMQEANVIFDELEKSEGTTKAIPGSTAPYIGGAVTAMSGATNQKLVQAKRDFVNAVLRKESGAVISDNEFKNADQQYFPQIGDSPEVIAQKKRNRELAVRGIAADVPDSENRLAQVRGPKAGGVMKVTNAEDYAKVPSGATYTTPDGKTRRKP